MNRTFRGWGQRGGGQCPWSRCPLGVATQGILLHVNKVREVLSILQPPALQALAAADLWEALSPPRGADDPSQASRGGPPL